MKEQPSADREEWIELVQKLRSPGFVRNSPQEKKKEKRMLSLEWEFTLFMSAIHCTEGNSITSLGCVTCDLLLDCGLVESRCFGSHQPGCKGWLSLGMFGFKLFECSSAEFRDHWLSSRRSCSLPLTVRDLSWPSSSTSTLSWPFSTIL